tara:strand:+ start:301 stop:1563 length:1263 start_codon:yes stop_codon:yes gene_type:complete
MKIVIFLVLTLLIIPPADAFNITSIFNEIESITGWQIVSPVATTAPTQGGEGGSGGGSPRDSCNSKRSCADLLKNLIKKNRIEDILSKGGEDEIDELVKKTDPKILIDAVRIAPVEVQQQFVIGPDKEGNEIIVRYPSCIDGTPYGECSDDIPTYCDNGNLIQDCARCGAKAGFTCKKIQIIRFNETNETRGLIREHLKAETCGEAAGICDIGCSASFTEIPKLKSSCLQQSPEINIEEVTGRYIFTGKQVAKSPQEKVCCVPTEKIGTFTVEALNNITTNRTIADPEETENICIDETEFNQCSPKKPLVCTEWGLFNYCSKCGCPSNQVCNFMTNTCVSPIEGTQSVFKQFIGLEFNSKSVVNQLLSNEYQQEEREDIVEIKTSPLLEENRILVNIDENVMTLIVSQDQKPHINLDFRE